MNDLRVAWLLTSAFYYWHPTLANFTKLYPQTKAFVTNWRGYAPGFEDSFEFEIVGDRKVISLKKSAASYGDNFTYLPLNIVNRLLEFKPQLIFSNSFGMWTILSLLFKPIGRWRVVIAYEGSSPGVDYRNSPLRLTVRRAMVQAADACITNSQAGKAYLTEILQAKADHVFVHPYEVPAVQALTMNIQAHQPDLPALQAPVFLFVGSISQRKGLQFLLEACKILHQKKCDTYSVLVVGDGTQRAELKQFCREHDLDHRVYWAGRVEYGALGLYFDQADVFILPTLEDTWGMVVLEAMILGKPVLCSQWAGASELIVEAENGYRFDPRTPERLAELMQNFIQNPEHVAEMGRKSEQLMMQYTPEASAKFLDQVTTFVMTP
ncbi:MAG: glycosyltransferase family 4 protein [Microcoleaceae cyanobacterium]